jgi:hypothetical protein
MIILKSYLVFKIKFMTNWVEGGKTVPVVEGEPVVEGGVDVEIGGTRIHVEDVLDPSTASKGIDWEWIPSSEQSEKLIQDWKPGNIESFLWDNWAIKTEEDFEAFLQNRKIDKNNLNELALYISGNETATSFVKTIIESEPEIGEFFFWNNWIIKTKEDFEAFLENKYFQAIEELICYLSPKNIELYLWEGLLINTLVDLK